MDIDFASGKIMQDMSSLEWQERSSKRVDYGDRTETDRISSLPDKVLGHILSFLPTKYAVGTSILSRRWKYLFTLITNLDFDEELMFDRRSSEKYLQLIHRRMRFHCENDMKHLKYASSFKDFVDRVLMFCKSPHISKFRLKCGLCFDSSNLNSWIRVALRRGVTDLDISTVEYDSSFLPLSLFISETLVVLKLRGKFEMKFPTGFRLPNLKLLHFFDVKFSDENCSLNRFIAGCPMLEDLVIGGQWEDVKDINVSSSTLRSLTMDFTDGFMSTYHRSNVVLDLPNLVQFKYIDYLASNYRLSNLNSLEVARIDILLDIDNMLFEYKTFCSSTLSLLNGVSKAKHLYLSGKCMEALTCDQYTLPIFHKLTRLELGWSRCVNWRHVLREFLHSSPVLERLDFAEGLLHRQSDDDYEDKTFWSRQRKAPPCLSTHLKIVTFDSFHGFDEELKIARYFLKHGKVLKKIILDWRIETKQEYKELMKLLKTQKASQECSFEFMTF